MNFLAHSYLSANNPQVLLGNFFADAVKGNHLNDYPDEICAGIRLHRMIDSFTDSHPVFIKSKRRIRNEYNKYSGIVVDIYYDHFLSLNWSDYSSQPLESFTNYVYQLLIRNYILLPARSRRILPFLVTQDWLTNYRNFESLQRVFEGMDRRTGGRSGMKSAVKILQEHYEMLGNDFRMFFTEVMALACDYLHEHDLSCKGIERRVA